MKHLVRSLKYFLYFTALTSLILFVLAKLGLVEPDVDSMFRQGYDSVWKILLVFAAISAVYPLSGFGRKSASVQGGITMCRKDILRIFSENGYVMESDAEDMLTFRKASMGDRIRRLFEDRITVTDDISGVTLEGPRKDIVRICLYLESALGGDRDSEIL